MSNLVGALVYTGFLGPCSIVLTASGKGGKDEWMEKKEGKGGGVNDRARDGKSFMEEKMREPEKDDKKG